MGDWFDSVTILDEIAFDEGPLETPTVWYDVSDYVQAFESFVGKTSLDSGFSPGYGRLVLDSPDRLFDPENAAGTYYGKLKPMRRYRRRVTVAAVTFTVFTGYVLSWDQDWRTKSSTVEVPLVDGTRFVENAPLTTSAYLERLEDASPTHLLRLDQTLTDSGSNAVTPVPTPGFGGVSSPMTLPVGDTTSGMGDSFLAVERGLNEYVRTISFIGTVGDGGTGSIAVSHSDLNDFGISIVDDGIYVLYNDEADSGYTTDSGASRYFPLPTDDAPHVWAATVISGRLYVLKDGQVVVDFALVTDTPGLSNFDRLNFSALETGASISHVATWASPRSVEDLIADYSAAVQAHEGEFGGARIGRVLDAMGFPAGLRDLDTGQTIHGPYRPNGLGCLDYLRQVETAEQGLVFFGPDGSVTFRDRSALWGGEADAVVFSDAVDDLFLLDEFDEPLLDENGAPLRPADGGGIEYVAGNPRGNPIDGVRNIVTASYNSVGGITRRDETSKTEYGEARESLDTPTLPDGRAASNLAAFVLREKKDPKTVFPALEIDMRPDPDAQMPAVFGLAPGKLATVRRTPMGVGAEVDKTAMVLGIGHRQEGRDANWRTTLFLAPALTQYDAGGYLRAGDALNDADPPVAAY